jgi:hypothetical protein
VVVMVVAGSDDETANLSINSDTIAQSFDVGSVVSVCCCRSVMRVAAVDWSV